MLTLRFGVIAWKGKAHAGKSEVESAPPLRLPKFWWGYDGARTWRNLYIALLAPSSTQLARCLY
jgi:hypothetical protein